MCFRDNSVLLIRLPLPNSCPPLMYGLILSKSLDKMENMEIQPPVCKTDATAHPPCPQHPQQRVRKPAICPFGLYLQTADMDICMPSDLFHVS